MSDYDFLPDFPKWFWYLVALIFVTGIVAIIGAIVCLCFYIIKHLHWN